MNRSMTRTLGIAALLAAVLLLGAWSAQARIDGLTGTNFDFTAKAGHISGADGVNILNWGFANAGGTMQYPGPTLIVNQGDTITINLTNDLTEPTSIVFPGQSGVVASEVSAPTQDGLLTREALTGGTVSYTFTATHAGTYLYHSGTQMELQVEMGLVGALIVRPAGFNPQNPRAYGHAGSSYDLEYLFLLTEMDSRIHDVVEFEGVSALKSTDYLSEYFPNYWFINGRNAPDTMLMAGVPWLPTQPYNCMPMMHPGEKLLMRVIGAGRNPHPYHHHGNNAQIIAKNGRLLESTAGAGPDLGWSVFTVKSVPGETADAIFEWTGAQLGWDIYGHAPGDALEPGEYAPDHGKPFPVTLPEGQNLTYGGFWTGSPYLGVLGSLPPGQGGMNPDAGYTYMWHSHTEQEMINNDIFPGGMMTMLMIVPHGVSIP